ncbi:MAG: class I SAM-dependent methyltransferase [Clostridiaceae bacterium]|nr:class I SAM-dependent methyltransferase [Clostridiaceae bacterium]
MQRESTPVFDLGFWRYAWEKEMRSSAYMGKRIRDQHETSDLWNKMATKYGEEDTNASRNRFQEVVGFLKTQNYIGQESDVLDVGCGNGVYALPFARQVRSVTAIDSAQEMCAVLKKKAEQGGIDNIIVRQCLWEEVDLVKEGMSQAFDLVFASLTPAVCNYETLMKLNEASRKYCCLITYAGKLVDQARHDLWQLIFGESISGRGFDVIYPFNILYNLGYCPKINYFQYEFVREETVEQAIESFCQYFWLFTDITSEVENIISNYVREKAVSGIFRSNNNVRLGIITWHI